MKELNIEDVKRVQVEVLKQVDLFCRTNGIQYFLAYGTLLGAVRHKGYIPWDDDIDIIMKRKDYESFLSEFNKSNSIMKAMHWSIDDAYPFEFAKIVDTTTSLVEDIDISYDNLGINIDCFVLDELPENKSEVQKMWKKIKRVERIVAVKRMLPNSRRKRTKGKAILTSVLKLIAKPIPIKSCMERIDSIAQACNGTAETSKVGNISQPYFGDNEILEKNWFSQSVEIEFEGCRFMAPSEMDKILTSWYGDYMQLPPIDKRVTHHRYKAYSL